MSGKDAAAPENVPENVPPAGGLGAGAGEEGPSPRSGVPGTSGLGGFRRLPSLRPGLHIGSVVAGLVVVPTTVQREAFDEKEDTVVFDPIEETYWR